MARVQKGGERGYHDDGPEMHVLLPRISLTAIPTNVILERLRMRSTKPTLACAKKIHDLSNLFIAIEGNAYKQLYAETSNLLLLIYHSRRPIRGTERRRMPVIRSLWKIPAVLILLLLLGDVRGQECAKPSQQEIADVLLLNLKANFSGSSFAPNITDVYSYNFTCLAVRGLDVYSSASVAIDYRYVIDIGSSGSEPLHALSQFEMECNGTDVWKPAANNTLESPPAEILTTQFCAHCVSDSLNTANGSVERLHNCYRKYTCLQQLCMCSSHPSFIA